jgi:hypothetical protein
MFTQASHVRDFLTAGRAVFTIKSLKTGVHFTYRITKKEEDGRPTVFFVGLLQSGDTFRYLGLLNFGPQGAKSDAATLRLTGKSCAGADAPSVAAMNYLLSNVYYHNRLPPQAEVSHEGKCCKCARPLTHPISLALGIGPECGALQHELFAEAVSSNVVPLDLQRVNQLKRA